ncbi:MAG: N-acetyltransferase [Victivallales bacterium]|jgi:ribosomal protein S18 acetylase RimI-like enzyme
MNTKIKVREAVSADADSIADFNIAMAWETESKKLSPDKIGSGVKALFKKPEYGFYVIADIDGTVAGSLMITYEWSDWRNGLFWWIQSVYVKPEFRRQGVYRAMFSYIKDLAGKNPGVCGCRLYVEHNNSIAQGTYKSLGMKETHYKMFEEVFHE